MKILKVVLFLIMATIGLSAGAEIKDAKTLQVEGQQIRVWDNGKGPVILLIHGMFGDHLDWEPILAPLAKNHRVIAIDLPGFGESSKPHTQYTADFFTDNIDALLRQLKVRKVVIAGNSFGGIVALYYALKHPARVEKLVLVDSGGLHGYSEEQNAATLVRFSEANIKLLTPQLDEMMFGPLFVNGPSPVRTRYIEKQNAKLKRTDFPDYAYSIHNSIRLAIVSDLRDRLKDIQAPTLLLQGEKDQVVQLQWVEAASKSFPRAQLKVLPNCGHVPQMECSGQVVKEIERFIREK